MKVGKWYKLTADQPVTWSSNNPNIHIEPDGWMVALRDALRPNGQGVITATAGMETANCQVTIVNWETERKKLEVTNVFNNAEGLQGFYPTKLKNGNILVSDGKKLYLSNTTFANMELLATFPDNLANTPILETPYGYFARSDNGYTGENTTTSIYHSTDLRNWKAVHTLGMTGLYHCFDFHYENNTLYVFAGEYGTNTSHRFKVHRGTYTSATNGTWDVALECFSQNEYRQNSANKPSVRHFHVATVDRRTGDLYVCAGDDNHECHMWVSTDNGNTFRVLGSGSQQYRILSVWFTDKYIYWNMDSAANQTIYRLERSKLGSQTPQNDQKETVAELYNGSHWYHCWGKDDLGEDIVIMGGAPEGQQRDWLSRVFSFKELPNGSVEVNELIALPSSTPDVYDNGITVYAQIEPKFYHNGKFYLRGRYTSPPASSTNRWVSGLLEMSFSPISQQKRYNWRKEYNFTARQ